MSSYEYDVAVIGGGPAGYVGAIRAAQMGGKVVLFEKDRVGGTCLNRGCIPTKTYLKTAETLYAVKEAAGRGIVMDTTASVDMKQVVKYKDKVVATLTGGVAGLLKANGVTVIKGEAALKDEHSIACGGSVTTAASILLCGGSIAGRIPIPGVDNPNVLDSTGMLELEEVPKRLCIIGGGVIGCELGDAFAAFGSEVTIIEAMDRLVATQDEDVSAELLKKMKAKGIAVHLKEAVKAIESDKDGVKVVCEGLAVSCDKVMLSIGRKADLSCLGDMKDSIKTERGKVVVNEYMQTNIPNIYAPGDLNGKLMLAHAAFKMAEIAAENAMGEKHRCDLRCTPSCIYTIPEAASVGISEKDAISKYGADNVLVGKFPMSANGRSLAAGEKSGFIKVIADKKYNELLGVHIVGADAAEMIAEPAALMQMEVTVDEAAHLIHGHPTFSEAFMEACADALGKCIHLPPRK